ncbi:MAG: serine/threonine protein kinase, partial [Pseudonocardia sp.]|nr:serine/threonine protein kinase [Pseudonocardia sp.]
MGLLPPGARIGDFVIEGLLGRGGMAEVYRATQVRLDRPVALKVLSGALSEDPAFAQRFLREAMIMRDLEHPAVVTVYDAGADDGRLYLAMRLLDTRTLRDLLTDGPLSPQRVLALLRPLAEALDHAHARGVVHRDIKPANILLDAGGRPYLADFGIAKALESASMTVSGQTLGTPRYMAPEQATGVVGHRSDLYAFACVAFEMLTGAPPFALDEPMALLFAHAHHPPPTATSVRPELPAGLDVVFARALAKQPLDRFGSAAELVAALDAAVGGAT